jgi:hypothetical protein
MIQPESMAARPSIADLASALCKAQAQMEGAKKDANNPHFKSKYADLASVWDAIRGPLTSNGLSVVQLLRSIAGGVEVETILMHASGQQISDVFAVPATKNDAQGYGSAATYARRYALMAMVGVAPEDDDGNAASGPAGSAGAGSQFRPERRQMPAQSSSHGRELAKQEPQLVDHDRQKGTAPVAKPAAGQTKDEQRAAKLKAATDKRVSALKSVTGWTRATLDEFWAENEEWIGWMSDPANGALTEYQRFSDAFADAEVNMRETV